MSTATDPGDSLWKLVERIIDELQKIIDAHKARKGSNLADYVKIRLSARVYPDFFIETEGKRVVTQRVAGRIQVTVEQALMGQDVIHDGVLVEAEPLEEALPGMFSVEVQWYKVEKDGPPVIRSPRE